MIQRTGITEMGLSDHELIHCSRKKSLLKLNEHYKISLSSMKNYSDQIFMEKLRSQKFPDYLNCICFNDVYQEFVSNFLSVVDSVSSTRNLRMKPNTKGFILTI